MAHQHVIDIPEVRLVVLALPTVRTIGMADVKDVIARGIDDFWTMPTHVMFLSLIYPIVGLALGRIGSS
jgi:uncharacterized membrane protein